MRLIVYGSFLIICCGLIQTSLGESRNYKKSKDDEDNSVERPSKYKGDKKYRTRYKADDDDSDEDYKIGKYRNRNAKEEQSGFTNEKNYSKNIKKSNKFTIDEEADVPYKKDKRNYRRDKENKEDVSEEDSAEDVASKNKKIAKDTKENKKHFGSNTGDNDDDDSDKTKRHFSRRNKHDDKDDNIEEHIGNKNKVSTNNSEEDVEVGAQKKKFRKKVRVRILSSEEESDESDEDYGKRARGTCDRKSKGGKQGQKSCPPEEGMNGGDGTGDERTSKKKIRYSIKFAHEKEKNTPPEENIMLKIHRGDKKKYRYEDDENDDSSEENTHPKRIHFLDDDDY